MSDPQRRLEQIACEHNLAPRFLRDIVYLSGIGYHQKHILEKADMSQDTVSKYRKKLREMDEETAAEIFELVAQVKRPLAESEQQQ